MLMLILDEGKGETFYKDAHVLTASFEITVT